MRDRHHIQGMASPHFWFVACINTIVAASALAAGSGGSDSGVDLTIAAVMDAASPTLAFTVTNRSTTPLEDRGLGRHDNRIEILTPKGEVTGYSIQIGGFADDTPFIQPGETVTRTIKIEDLSSR